MLRVARFLRSYVRHPWAGVGSEEVLMGSGEGAVPATLFRPDVAAPLPGWIVLHGLTVPGREHAALQRFASSLAGSGAAVLVPEISAWRELRVDPEVAHGVIARSAEYLASRADIEQGGVGLIGFSFGATQALVSTARDKSRTIRSVVSFGAYCDPAATFRFAFTGEHEWKGRRYRVLPDPYGRWIVAANFLTEVPEYEGMGRVATAARGLAIDAGQKGVYAADALYDDLKAEFRAGLNPEEQRVWDLVAPPAGVRADPVAAGALGERIAAAAVARQPGLDPRPTLPSLDRYTVLAHGFHDHLIPFSETLRLREYLSPRSGASLTISRLFAHSREAPRPRAYEYPREAFLYLRLLDRALRPR